MKTQYLYSLARRGKWICPQCGKKTFVCYVNQNGDVLDPKVGKCDRADKCAFHYPPRAYFADHRLDPAQKNYHSHAPNKVPEVVRTFNKSVSFFDIEVMKQSVYGCQKHKNNFITFLEAHYGKKETIGLVGKYLIGTSKYWPGATVFWQMDRTGHVRAGKIMLYNATTGKREKQPFNHITWAHTAMHIENFVLNQCLFGEHLLVMRPDATVALFESEKTAVIASTHFVEDIIVLACGGCGNFTSKMLNALRGRDVVLFPDNGKYREWYEKGQIIQSMFKRLRIARVMERHAAHEGDDLADLLLDPNIPDEIDLDLNTVHYAGYYYLG